MTQNQQPISNKLLERNVRTMMRRYAAHLESGNHILREGSQQEIAHSTIDYFNEIDTATGSNHTGGYYVAPGGLGKTVTGGDLFVGINTMPSGRYVLGDPALGKRVLVGVATNQLADQWGHRLLGEVDEETGRRKPSIFGDRFSHENVGVYHANLSDKEKEEALSKAIVIAVHDSTDALYYHYDHKAGVWDPRINPEDFDLVLIDEVDDRVRGDVTREFYQSKFFPNCMVIGCTATHRFKDGKTIGDHLFGGKQPICEILHEDAIHKREIAPHINIIIEPTIDLSSEVTSLTTGWDDYSESQQLRFIEQAGTDQALLEAIRVGNHPKTGKPLRDMMQLHQAVNIEHGRLIAQQLNEEFGKGYAEAVWGGTDEEMDEETRRLMKYMLEKGDIRAVIQCKLWGRGTDIPELELTAQHAPSLSPNKIIQFHTRASRRADGKKIALYLSPFINGIDQLVIGELLGGLYMIPPGYDFPKTAGVQNEPSDPQPWPEIEGVEVHYTERHLNMFAKRRQRQKEAEGLEIKPRNMMTLEQMAKALNIDSELLRRRVYAPVQAAYEKKQARQEFVDLSDILHVRGKIFPARRMGFYLQGKESVFCIEKDLMPLCEHTLYGRLSKTPAEVLDKDTARRILECSPSEIEMLWRELQHAFFDRKNYERQIKISGVSFSYDSFGFFTRQSTGISEMFISPDALIPAYRRLKGATFEEARSWAQKPAVHQCKTSDWYTKSDVMEALDLNSLAGSRDVLFVEEVFLNLDRESRRLRVGNEAELSIIIDRSRQTLKCSKKWLPMGVSHQQTALVIDKKAFQWIKSKLDTKSGHEARSTFRAGRSGFRPGPDMAP